MQLSENLFEFLLFTHVNDIGYYAEQAGMMEGELVLG